MQKLIALFNMQMRKIKAVLKVKNHILTRMLQITECKREATCRKILNATLKDNKQQKSILNKTTSLKRNLVIFYLHKFAHLK